MIRLGKCIILISVLAFMALTVYSHFALAHAHASRSDSLAAIHQRTAWASGACLLVALIGSAVLARAWIASGRRFKDKKYPV